jgi:hypothetical protein
MSPVAARNLAQLEITARAIQRDGLTFHPDCHSAIVARTRFAREHVEGRLMTVGQASRIAVVGQARIIRG